MLVLMRFHVVMRTKKTRLVYTKQIPRKGATRNAIFA